MNQKKENKERCDYIRKQLTEFYKTKYVSLENDRKRYRAKAQELIEKNRNLENLNERLRIENEKLVNRVEYYRDLYVKERNKEK